MAAEILTETIIYCISVALLIVLYIIYKRNGNGFFQILALVLIFFTAFFYIDDKEIYDVSLVFIWLYALRSIITLHVLNRDKVISNAVLVILDISIIISICMKAYGYMPCGLSAWFFLSPFIEELFFRGFIYEKMDRVPSIYPSLLFSISHWDSGEMLFVVVSKVVRIGFSEMLYYLRNSKWKIPILGMVHLAFNIAVVVTKNAFASIGTQF